MIKNRRAMITVLESWLGKNRADGSFIEIINEYNKKAPFPRNVKMVSAWHWCACTISAAAKKLGYEDIIPIEISCYYMVEAARKMGIWVEDDAYIPKKGDIVLYDWDDNGIGDCTGSPEHVGLITKVEKANRRFIVIEGNYNNAVRTRPLAFNARYIRGFITPEYDIEGEDFVDKKGIITSTYEPIGQDKAKLSGKYEVTRATCCRINAGKNKKALVKFKKGLKVNCSNGKFTERNSVKWLYVTGTVNGLKYRGFCNSKCLKKVG